MGTETPKFMLVTKLNFDINSHLRKIFVHFTFLKISQFLQKILNAVDLLPDFLVLWQDVSVSEFN